MVTPELLTYIQTSLEKNTSKEVIIKALENANWSAKDITDAFSQIENPSIESSNTKDTTKEEFEVVIEHPQTKESTIKTILTIFFLLTFPPLGLLLMWILPKWKLGIKILITIPYLIAIALLIIIFSHIGKRLLESQKLIYEDTSKNECVIDNDCTSGFCIFTSSGHVCSDGLLGDPCYLDSDCLSGHCPDNYCTEGTEGDPCFLSFDCEEPLMCGDDGTCQ